MRGVAQRTPQRRSAAVGAEQTTAWARVELGKWFANTAKTCREDAMEWREDWARAQRLFDEAVRASVTVALYLCRFGRCTPVCACLCSSVALTLQSINQSMNWRMIGLI